MPQFDSITFFNQIFWLICFFIVFYYWLVADLLPLYSLILKVRLKIKFNVLLSPVSRLTTNLLYFLNNVLKSSSKLLKKN